ncbi:MAG: carboxypeptidase-like regulatory domain-containing protein [Patescibacteria group bacterium]
MRGKEGTSLIDLLIALAILALLFGGIYLVYFSILDSTSNVELRTEATAVLNQQIEIIRNLPYGEVGTVGGIPTGIILQTQLVSWGNQVFAVTTTVRNIDDPFDGTLGGSPSDTSPADYKLVSLEIGCANCAKFVPLFFSTNVAPKNLETASSTGSLFVNVFDSSGLGISGATVRVVNASTTPTIDLTDITNSAGILQLVGVPTSSQSYSVEVTKSGYSSDKTYPIGGVSNPNPIMPHATVAAQAVTSISFAIDRTSQMNVYTSDYLCSVVPGKSFSIAGEKIIGTPSVLKFSTTSVTDANGAKTFTTLEWDRYTLGLTSGGHDVSGVIAENPVSVNPATNVDFRFVLSPSNPEKILVGVKDAGTGLGIQNANISLSRPGFSSVATSGQASVVRTNWSGGAYDSLSGTDAETLPGAITLLANASGTYSTAGSGWLISQTIDLGGSASTLKNFFWNGDVPAETGAESVRFQLAGNNDNATWDFSGTDGTSGTYYTAANFEPHSVTNGKRYIRFKAFLSTADGSFTPRIEEVMIAFTGACVPIRQVLFSGLAADTYTLSVSAAGYSATSSDVSIPAVSQVEVLLSP